MSYSLARTFERLLMLRASAVFYRIGTRTVLPCCNTCCLRLQACLHTDSHNRHYSRGPLSSSPSKDEQRKPDWLKEPQEVSKASRLRNMIRKHQISVKDIKPRLRASIIWSKSRLRAVLSQRAVQDSSVALVLRRQVLRSKLAADGLRRSMQRINEKLLTIPNVLSISRIALTPVLGYFVISGDYRLSCVLFAVAGATDLIDGYIARTYPSQRTMFGSFIDPLADKFLVVTLFLTLTYNGLIPAPLTGFIIGRDTLLLIAGFYVRYISLSPPKTLRRYFDVSLPTAQLKPTLMGKVNTAVQLGLVGLTLGAPVFNYVDHWFLHAAWFLSATTTLMSGISYVISGHSSYIIVKSGQTGKQKGTIRSRRRRKDSKCKTV